MQKKLIALAIAGFASTAAFAQTNVTLYGVADVSIEAVGATGDSTPAGNANLGNSGRVNSNSSYIGFKGTEDLGNGLNALFQFETGFAADTGVYNGAARDTYVGLSGGFGTVTAGNLTTASRGLTVRMEMLPGNAGVGTADSVLGGGTFLPGVFGVPAVSARIANAVQYQSPDISGFNFSAAYGFGENKQLNNVVAGTSAVNNSKRYDIGLNYMMGGWDLGYAYTHYSSEGDLAGSLDTAKNHHLGLGYHFDGGHRVTLQLDRLTADAIGGGDITLSSYSLQGEFMITPTGGLIAEYNVARDVSGGGGAADTGARMYTVGYLQNLSKRTLVKLLYSRINNDNNVAYDFAQAPVDPNFLLGAGADPHALSIGLRHSF